MFWHEDLKELKDDNNRGKPLGTGRQKKKLRYCKRIQFMIQDVLETRAKGWAKKVFKATAKTREELMSGPSTEAEHIVTGKRPVYLA